MAPPRLQRHSTQTNGVNGGPAAHISVTSAGTSPWHIELQQFNLSLTAGQEYEVQFWARASVPLTFQTAVQSGTSPYSYYGAPTSLTVGAVWAPYSMYFVAPATANDATLEFQLGSQAGDLWLDNVQLFTAPTRLYRRDFTNGVVLLNGTSTTQTISLDSGMKRFSGTQAPKIPIHCGRREFQLHDQRVLDCEYLRYRPASRQRAILPCVADALCTNWTAPPEAPSGT